jgi:hypothetical protein
MEVVISLREVESEIFSEGAKDGRNDPSSQVGTRRKAEGLPDRKDPVG